MSQNEAWDHIVKGRAFLFYRRERARMAAIAKGAPKAELQMLATSATEALNRYIEVALKAEEKYLLTSHEEALARVAAHPKDEAIFVYACQLELAAENCRHAALVQAYTVGRRVSVTHSFEEG